MPEISQMGRTPAFALVVEAAVVRVSSCGCHCRRIAADQFDVQTVRSRSFEQAKSAESLPHAAAIPASGTVESPPSAAEHWRIAGTNSPEWSCNYSASADPRKWNA